MFRIISKDPLTTGLNANRTGAHCGSSISLSFTAGHVGDNEMDYLIPTVQWLKDGRNHSTLVPYFSRHKWSIKFYSFIYFYYF